MSVPGVPFNFYVQQGNGQVLCSWSLLSGATSYKVQRSTDGVTFSVVSSPASNSFLDTTVTVGTTYFYQVAGVNSDGTGPYTSAQGIVPATSGNLSLGAIRVASQQRADRVGSQFVTLPEWNFFINQAAYELYDLLITTYEEYAVAQPVSFRTNGSTYIYALPDGITTWANGITGVDFVAQPFYKLLGVDLGLQNAPNGYVTVKKFNFIDRNKYVFPNTASTIYGVFNLQYRLLGNSIEFIPVPSANQPVRIWYIPRLVTLLQDSDLLDGVSGWTQYVIVRAAKYALDKEEGSDTTKLDEELVFLTKRIQDSGMNRDAGQPDTISDTRGPGWGGWNGPFSGRPSGGW